jgi:hypothetical protein
MREWFPLIDPEAMETFKTSCERVKMGEATNSLLQVNMPLDLSRPNDLSWLAIWVVQHAQDALSMMQRVVQWAPQIIGTSTRVVFVVATDEPESDDDGLPSNPYTTHPRQWAAYSSLSRPPSSSTSPSIVPSHPYPSPVSQQPSQTLGGNFPLCDF